MAAEKTATKIELPPLDIQSVEITLIGDSPLICHKWSEKAKKAILDKQMKKATAKKEAKDPEEDYEESLYQMPDGSYGFPAQAFKSSAVAACRYVSGLPMTVARGAFHIDGEFVTIEGSPQMREDMVRIGMGTADIRYRGEFKEWRTTITVRFNARVISPEQVINLFNTAGFSCGVAEWRPERNGGFGLFHVATEGEL